MTRHALAPRQLDHDKRPARAEARRRLDREALWSLVGELAAEFAHAPAQIGHFVRDEVLAGRLPPTGMEEAWVALAQRVGPAFADRAFGVRLGEASELAAAICADVRRARPGDLALASALQEGRVQGRRVARGALDRLRPALAPAAADLDEARLAEGLPAFLEARGTRAAAFGDKLVAARPGLIREEAGVGVGLLAHELSHLGQHRAAGQLRAVHFDDGDTAEDVEAAGSEDLAALVDAISRADKADAPGLLAELAARSDLADACAALDDPEVLGIDRLFEKLGGDAFEEPQLSDTLVVLEARTAEANEASIRAVLSEKGLNKRISGSEARLCWEILRALPSEARAAFIANEPEWFEATEAAMKLELRLEDRFAFFEGDMDALVAKLETAEVWDPAAREELRMILWMMVQADQWVGAMPYVAAHYDLDPAFFAELGFDEHGVAVEPHVVDGTPGNLVNLGAKGLAAAAGSDTPLKSLGFELHTVLGMGKRSTTEGLSVATIQKGFGGHFGGIRFAEGDEESGAGTISAVADDAAGTLTLSASSLPIESIAFKTNLESGEVFEFGAESGGLDVLELALDWKGSEDEADTFTLKVERAYLSTCAGSMGEMMIGAGAIEAKGLLISGQVPIGDKDNPPSFADVAQVHIWETLSVVTDLLSQLFGVVALPYFGAAEVSGEQLASDLAFLLLETFRDQVGLTLAIEGGLSITDVVSAGGESIEAISADSLVIDLSLQGQEGQGIDGGDDREALEADTGLAPSALVVTVEVDGPRVEGLEWAGVSQEVIEAPEGSEGWRVELHVPIDALDAETALSQPLYRLDFNVPAASSAGALGADEQGRLSVVGLSGSATVLDDSHVELSLQAASGSIASMALATESGFVFECAGAVSAVGLGVEASIEVTHGEAGPGVGRVYVAELRAESLSGAGVRVVVPDIVELGFEEGTVEGLLLSGLDLDAMSFDAVVIGGGEISGLLAALEKGLTVSERGTLTVGEAAVVRYGAGGYFFGLNDLDTEAFALEAPGKGITFRRLDAAHVEGTYEDGDLHAEVEGGVVDGDVHAGDTTVSVGGEGDLTLDLSGTDLSISVDLPLLAIANLDMSSDSLALRLGTVSLDQVTATVHLELTEAMDGVQAVEIERLAIPLVTGRGFRVELPDKGLVIDLPSDKEGRIRGVWAEGLRVVPSDQAIQTWITAGSAGAATVRTDQASVEVAGEIKARTGLSFGEVGLEAMSDGTLEVTLADISALAELPAGPYTLEEIMAGGVDLDAGDTTAGLDLDSAKIVLGPEGVEVVEAGGGFVHYDDGNVEVRFDSVRADTIRGHLMGASVESVDLSGLEFTIYDLGQLMGGGGGGGTGLGFGELAVLSGLNGSVELVGVYRSEYGDIRIPFETDIVDGYAEAGPIEIGIRPDGTPEVRLGGTVELTESGQVLVSWHGHEWTFDLPDLGASEDQAETASWNAPVGVDDVDVALELEVPSIPLGPYGMLLFDKDGFLAINATGGTLDGDEISITIDVGGLGAMLQKPGSFSLSFGSLQIEQGLELDLSMEGVKPKRLKGFIATGRLETLGIGSTFELNEE